MTERRTLIKGGAVLTMDPELGDLPRGDVLVEGRRIAAVAAELDVPADETVDAANTLVMPGLIDSHVHLWQVPLRGLAAQCWAGEYFPTVHPLAGRYRPEDMYAATYGGAVEALSHGTTTVVDFCHSVNSPEHADASVAALRDAGVRALFGYSFRDRPEVARRAFTGHDQRVRDAARVADALAGDGLVRMAIALNNIDHVDAPTGARELACARELGVLATVHSVDPGDIDELHRRDLLGPDIVWVHQESAGPEQLALLAARGGVIAVTPEIEAGMSGRYPVTGRALRHGVPVTLGVDIPSGVNADLLVQLRLAFQLQRLFDAQRERMEGRDAVRTPRVPALTARDVVRLATVDAARALGLGDRAGSLIPGKDADVLLLATAPFGLGAGDLAAHVVCHASAADVDSVLVAGEFRKRGGRLVGVDEGRLRRDLAAARGHVLAGAR
ncbi:amidohydrolase family protein [Pseudonocardia acaciae]|uniref:amidohydrolase family protein n=1 Tax=Pseudonocardia acaciae TaxID=551276 RepID=UPI000688A271|nr:amidohydrolase family protein [Pseudonocardia acaciae]